MSQVTRNSPQYLPGSLNGALGVVHHVVSDQATLDEYARGKRRQRRRCAVANVSQRGYRQRNHKRTQSVDASFAQQRSSCILELTLRRLHLPVWKKELREGVPGDRIIPLITRLLGDIWQSRNSALPGVVP